MKTLTVFFFLALFLLLRPYHLELRTFWYIDDDYDYFAHASALARGDFPHYHNEFFLQKNKPMGAVGSGILAAPFVFVFSQIDRLTNAPAARVHNEETLLHSWSLFGFVVGSICYFWLGCMLLYKGLLRHFPHRQALWAVGLMVLCQGLPLFAFRRPVFSHVFEFFLQSCLVYLLLRFCAAQWTWKDLRLRAVVGIGVLCGLMALVRYNNAFLALVWPLVLGGVCVRDFKEVKFWRYLAIVYGCLAAMVFAFKILPDMIVPSYYLTSRLTSFHPFMFYLQRLVHVIFGHDWGLVYTAPFACLALLLLWKPDNVEKRLLWPLAFLAINLYCIISWNSQGSWYGYRYLIASLFPLLVYPLAKAVNFFDTKPYRSAAYFTLAVLAVVPALSMMAFEGRGGHLNLASDPTLGWTNNAYQVQIWQTLLFKPDIMFEVMTTAGPAYLLYCWESLLSALHWGMKPYFYEYSDFKVLTLAKLLVLYALPFFLLRLWNVYVEKNPFKRN